MWRPSLQVGWWFPMTTVPLTLPPHTMTKTFTTRQRSTYRSACSVEIYCFMLVSATTITVGWIITSQWRSFMLVYPFAFPVAMLVATERQLKGEKEEKEGQRGVILSPCTGGLRLYTARLYYLLCGDHRWSLILHGGERCLHLLDDIRIRTLAS